MRRIWLVALLVTAGGWDALRAPDPDVDKGNEAFKAGRFDEALGHYRSAESRGVDPRLHFDMGAALYRLGEKSGDDAARAKLFQEAEEQFRRAADSDDMQLKSLAYFNLGNAMYQRQQWEDAVAAYKRALRADTNNEAARHNLEMALRQREKQDKQEQQQQGQKGQKGDKGKKQDQQQDQKGGQGQGQKDPQEHQDGQGKQDQQQGKPGQQDKDQAPQGGQPQGDQPEQQQQSGGERRPEDQKQAEREEQARRQQQERERQQAQSPDDDSAGTDSPTDQERKLDELERRSRELRKRLLRQGGKGRDAQHLPSRRDW
jgi:Ca-activated chloride channel homolog